MSSRGFEKTGELVPVTFTHYPEAVLNAVKVLRWYLKDGSYRWPLARYTWVMAHSILGVHAQKGKWRLESYWRKRLFDFGIDPDTCQVIDQRKFGVMWQEINEHHAKEGKPWRMPLEDFLRAYRASFQSGYKTAGPFTRTVMLPARTSPRASSRHPWKMRSRDGKAIEGAKKIGNLVYQSRIKKYLEEMAEI